MGYALMKALLLLLALLLPGIAQAQNFGNIKPHTVLGNPDPTNSKPAVPIPFDNLSPVVTPKAFGALCNGTNDDTAAIQAAVNASNRVMFDRNCVITSTVTLHGSMILEGTTRNRVAPFNIICQTTTADCINVPQTSSGVVIRNMSIGGGTPTAGNMLTLTKVGDFTLDNVSLVGGFNLVKIVGGNTMLLNNVYLGTARGQYALKWDSDGAGDGSGDLLNITNSLIACDFKATPSQTADGIVWDGYTHTLNLTNVLILRCNHGIFVDNSRGNNLFPQFMFADNIQIEGMVSNSIRARGGSDIWITNSYLKNQPSPAQGQADGAVLSLECDTVAGVRCGSSPSGSSTGFIMSNSQIFSNTTGPCVFVDWYLTQITNSQVKLCSGTTHLAPSVRYGTNVTNALLSNNLIMDNTGNYAVEVLYTGGSGSNIRLKDNVLNGVTGPVNDPNNSTDGLGTSNQIFIQVSAGTNTGSASTGLKKITTFVCAQSGNNNGGAFYMTSSGSSVTVVQTTTSAQAYNCIVGGW